MQPTATAADGGDDGVLRHHELPGHCDGMPVPFYGAYQIACGVNVMVCSQWGLRYVESLCCAGWVM